MLKNNIFFKIKIPIFITIIIFFSFDITKSLSKEVAEENTIYDLGGKRGIFIDETGDWTTLCDYNDKDYCSLMQFIQSEDENTKHRALIQIIKKQKKSIMHIWTPDGFPLNPGVGIIFNDNNQFKEYKLWIPYTKCRENKCRAELILDNSLIKKFNLSDHFIIVIHPDKIKRIGLIIPNKGFEVAFKKMKTMPN